MDARPTPLSPAARYLWTTVACAVTTLLTLPLLGVIDLANIVMVFLLTVAGVALALGSGPAVLAAIASVVLFDFFYVQPRFSMAVADSQYLITFTVMLVVGLVLGQLTARLREQAEQMAARARETDELYVLARELAGAIAPEQMGEKVSDFLQRRLHVLATLFLPVAEGKFVAWPARTSQAQLPLTHVAAVQRSGEPMWLAAQETGFEPGLALPLTSALAVRGVLLVHSPSLDDVSAPENRRLIDAVCSLLAIAVERLHFSEVAAHVQMAVESERLRNALLSAVSHDLRTPLTVLVGLADTLALKTPANAPEVAVTVQTIHEQALRMSGQVGKLLDMARLQTGQIRLQRDWQPVDEVVGSALSHLPEADRIHVADLQELPWLQIDAVLIERVLVNLLENACKYAPQGPIELSARVVGSTMEITIEDSGPGIVTENAEQLFALFQRGCAESSVAGVGLGLPICRAIARAHGGDVLLCNRASGGACALLSLPLGTPPSLPEANDD